MMTTRATASGGRRYPGWKRRLDAWLFASQRADYFDYLHAVLEGSEGRFTLRELFDRDAQRYGPGTVRGRLSWHWARTAELAGGDLYATWRESFPPDELLLIRSAQSFGNARLLACFRALSDHLDLLDEARRLLWSTLGAAAAALLIASVLLLALPAWTVPTLQHSFQGLPPTYLGGAARSLFGVAGLLARWGWLLPLGVVASLVAGFASLPRSTGPVRQWLDRRGPWRLYRQYQALRLLALVALLLQSGRSGSAPLRPVLQLLLEGASPWWAWHVRGMLRRVDQGRTDASAFDTGLLDAPLLGFLDDMVIARDLSIGLQRTQARLAGLWMGRIRREALALRWVALLSGVAVVLGLGLWHYAAIDDLRRAWMMFHTA